MELPEELLCLFTAQVEERDESLVVEVPRNEIEVGDVRAGETYRVALFARETGQRLRPSEPASTRGAEPETKGAPGVVGEPPVEEGETVEVEIEDIGDQGDGIARIGPGYIVFVPDTGVGDRVTVEITQVKDNFAFGDVVEGPY